MKREQDEEGRTCRRIKFQKVVSHIITNEEIFDLSFKSVGDSSLPDHIQYLYQDTCNHMVYDAWNIDRPFPKAFE